jgi:hypothetical protein
MGFFNTLFTETTCPRCGAKSEIRIQYKYGNTRQLHHNMGDAITWGGNDVGNPAFTKVKTYGIAESTTCTLCNEDCIPEEYDVFIIDNTITEITPMKSIDEYLASDESYVILE